MTDYTTKVKQLLEESAASTSQYLCYENTMSPWRPMVAYIVMLYFVNKSYHCYIWDGFCCHTCPVRLHGCSSFV